MHNHPSTIPIATAVHADLEIEGDNGDNED